MDTLILILGMILQELIPAAAIGATIVVLVRTRTGRDLMKRLMGPTPDASDLASLKDQVARLQEELVETQERLDFTERTLVRPDSPQGYLREPTPEEVTPV